MAKLPWYFKNVYNVKQTDKGIMVEYNISRIYIIYLYSTAYFRWLYRNIRFLINKLIRESND